MQSAPTPRRSLATVLAGFCLVFTLVIAAILWRYLPFTNGGSVLSSCVLVTGSAITVLVYKLSLTLPRTRRNHLFLLSLGLVLVAIPVVSMWSQRITYAKFGLTVYGIFPVPVFDITVNRHGVLWFRTKSHTITRRELDDLIGPEVEVVVVGVGWDRVAVLTDGATELGKSIDLRVLATPDAFRVFNELKSEGRVVVLLAHSTC